MKYTYILLVALVVFSCKEASKEKEPKSEEESPKLAQTTYKAELKIDDAVSLPFLFKVVNETKIEVYNAEEVITVDEVSYKNDSVFIKMPVFEGIINAKIEGEKLSGLFIIPEKDREMLFTASPNSNRFEETKPASEDISGVWETTFSPNSEEDRYIAKGIFKQNGQKITGTFRTTTGDYRFLEGVINGNEFEMSTFDGAHAFYFRGKIKEDTLKGVFFSGNHWSEPFEAKRNAAYELPDENTLTYLKEGYDTVEFSFPDENGTMISLSDDRFKNKVVVLQIMGTWCPNCLDESKYLAQYYKEHSKDLEIIGLAFEYVKTEEKAFANINRLKERIGITYPILLAQVGSSSKAKANDKLPMLNHVLSYPTTIILDKNGKVRKIQTGFNGPATGERYTKFKAEFESLIANLKVE
jgi:thiol-disulfide isomerase/thioredoxin